MEERDQCWWLRFAVGVRTRARASECAMLPCPLGVASRGNVTVADLRYYHTKPPRLGPTPSRGPLTHPVRTGALGGAGGDVVV